MDEVVLTSDDSTSVHSEKFDALYHSKHGAIQESLHVFVNAGLEYFVNTHNPSNVNILELGYGTGLNAYLTSLYLRNKNLQCNYTGLEAYPVQKSVHDLLNYGTESCDKELFDQFYNTRWEESKNITSNFSLLKKESFFQDLSDVDSYDIIYFDAFAPSTQPALWEAEIIKKMYSATKSEGILVTYCAKGVVRRTLQDVGYVVERIPGPPGKRQMMRATKK